MHARASPCQQGQARLQTCCCFQEAGAGGQAPHGLEGMGSGGASQLRPPGRRAPVRPPRPKHIHM
eukprot:290398-Chlamydomonas_euryale.AAC.2